MAKVIFSQACVILSTGGGACSKFSGGAWSGTPPGRHPPWQAPPGRHPPGRHPPWQAPPLWQAPPRRHPPWDTVKARPVRILLECILVLTYFLISGLISSWNPSVFLSTSTIINRKGNHPRHHEFQTLFLIKLVNFPYLVADLQKFWMRTPGPFFLHFHAVSGNFGRIIGSRLLSGLQPLWAWIRY